MCGVFLFFPRYLICPLLKWDAYSDSSFILNCMTAFMFLLSGTS